MVHRKHHHHGGYSYRRRHNPIFEKSELIYAGWGVVGAVGARALPQIILPDKNTGILGYGLNLGAALVLKFVGNAVDKGAGEGLFIGGLIATGMRIVQENFGTKIQGLSGDAGFNLGAYWQSYFAVPTSSDPYGRVSASPYPQPVAALPPARGGGTMGRFQGRFSRFTTR